MRIICEPSPNGYWRVTVEGRTVIDQESYTVASNVAHALATNGGETTTEAREVAESIRRSPYYGMTSAEVGDYNRKLCNLD